jgi:hypothetical protein
MGAIKSSLAAAARATAKALFKGKAGDKAERLFAEWGLTEDELTTARIEVQYRRYFALVPFYFIAMAGVFTGQFWLCAAPIAIEWAIFARWGAFDLNRRFGNPHRDLPSVNKAIKNKKKSNRPPRRRLFGILPPKKPAI